jgi:hypothetical protein
MITATLDAYRAALTTTLAALRRAPLALAALVLGQAAILFVAVLVSPLGLLGGFVVGILAAAITGTYLSLIEQALGAQRPMAWSALRESFGDYLWEVISVLFFFWIAGWLLGGLGLGVQGEFLMWLAVTVLFNPVPELIYHRRGSRAVELLPKALSWVQQHGPEWFTPMVLLGLGVYLLEPSLMLGFVQAFGPRFGFMEGLHSVHLAVGVLTLGGGLKGLVLCVVVPVLTHTTMLFRGALFRELDGGSRRQRAWKAKF